ncbi:MAG TPA: hypothetical protein VH083_01120 [Myxococcales bacterium]|jgi:hypothetical protein|nr:hypothetical protein [Myxococcales bacterium]
MSQPDQTDWQTQLQASLRRAQEAIARGSTQQDQMVRDWTENLRTAYPDWGRERWQRRLERKLRRRAEREAKIANASLFEGYAWLLGAILCFILALQAWPVMFWLLFPAAGLASRGTRVIARHTGISGPKLTTETQTQIQSDGQVQAPIRQAVAPGPSQERQRAERFGSIGGLRGGLDARPAAAMAPLAVQQDERDVRVDAICNKILLELKSAPDAVKEIFIKPEETVASLRATCRDLTRRERDLRKFLAPADDERLMREREALQKRIEAESDDVTKMRLASALAALDQQRDQRLELKRAAARFDAEHTRISYTLESLYTQVVRMQSADSSSVDLAGAGLRRSLDFLSQEVNELADALEKVNSGEAERMRKVAQGPGAESATPPQAPGTREKA